MLSEIDHYQLAIYGQARKINHVFTRLGVNDKNNEY